VKVRDYEVFAGKGLYIEPTFNLMTCNKYSDQSFAHWQNRIHKTFNIYLDIVLDIQND